MIQWSLSLSKGKKRSAISTGSPRGEGGGERASLCTLRQAQGPVFIFILRFYYNANTIR